MVTLFKFAIRNLKKKKLRCLLIILTFSLSAISIMSSVFIKDAALDSRIDALRRESSNIQLSIVKSDEKSPFFKQSDVADKIKKLDNIKCIVTKLVLPAKINKTSQGKITLAGTDYPLQEKIYPFDFLKSKNIKPFEGKVIIGSSTAQKYNLHVGGSLRVYYGDKKASYVVSGICKDEGIFRYNGMAVISLDDARKLLGDGSKATTVDVEIKNLDRITETKDDIVKSLGKEYDVEQYYDIDYYKAFVGTLNIALSIFSLFAVFITLYLSYNTYKAVTFERISQIGTLRSIGASKKQIVFSMYLENLFIIIASTVLGIILSIPFMSLCLKILTGDSILLKLSFIKVAFIFILLLAVGLLSVRAAITQVMKISIVDIIKGNIKSGKMRFAPAKYSASTILLLLSFYILINYSKFAHGDILLSIALAAFILAIILITGLWHKLLNVTIYRVFKIFGPIIRNAVNELKNNFSSTAETVMLVAIVIGIAYMSYSTSELIKKSACSVYKGTDILLSAPNVDKDFANITGIKTMMSEFKTTRKIDGFDADIVGINPLEYRGFSFEIFKSADKNEVFGQLNNGRNIIVTTTFSRVTGKKPGDAIILKTGAQTYTYKIIGVCSSFENMGKNLFISKKNFTSDLSSNADRQYLIKIEKGFSQDNVLDKIKNALCNDDYYELTTIKNLMRENDEQNNKLFLIINILFAICVLVSVISLNNNIMINIIKNKKTYAVKRTIGMSRKQLFRSVSYSGMLQCLEGGILGVFMGIVMNMFLVRILSYYIGDLAVDMNVLLCLVLLAAALAVGFSSSYFPFLKLSKMNLIDLVKNAD